METVEAFAPKHDVWVGSTCLKVAKAMRRGRRLKADGGLVEALGAVCNSRPLHTKESYHICANTKIYTITRRVTCSSSVKALRSIAVFVFVCTVCTNQRVV